MKKLNPSQLVIVCLVGVLIYQQFFMGNTYKKEYERMLKEKENEYLSQIEKLESEADSLLQLNLGLSNQIAEIDNQIDAKNAQLLNLRKRYEEQLDKFDDMSDDDLITAFANAFN
jgi:DNA repair exonuclease SbcCD ATPase subunit